MHALPRIEERDAALRTCRTTFRGLSDVSGDSEASSTSDTDVVHVSMPPPAAAGHCFAVGHARMTHHAHTVYHARMTHHAHTTHSPSTEPPTRATPPRDDTTQRVEHDARCDGHDTQHAEWERPLFAREFDEHEHLCVLLCCQVHEQLCTSLMRYIRLNVFVATCVTQDYGAPAFRMYVVGSRVGIQVSVPPFHLPSDGIGRVCLVVLHRRKGGVANSSTSSILRGKELFSCVYNKAWGFPHNVYPSTTADLHACAVHVYKTWKRLGTEPKDDDACAACI